MNLHNARFEISAVSPAQYPKDGIKEIAFAGRSNVGKSSIINKLLNRKSLARTSSKPGKTATINFYNIDDALYFVDLPGYGYAARSKSETKHWGEMMEQYLAARPQLLTTVLLVDSRHKPTEDDKIMLDWIRHYYQNIIVVATKVDKLKKSEIGYKLEMIEDVLDLTEDDILIPFSINDDEGRLSLLDLINLLLEGSRKE